VTTLKLPVRPGAVHSDSTDDPRATKPSTHECDMEIRADKSGQSIACDAEDRRSSETNHELNRNTIESNARSDTTVHISFRDE
jgi:hypothetical protein